MVSWSPSLTHQNYDLMDGKSTSLQYLIPGYPDASEQSVEAGEYQNIRITSKPKIKLALYSIKENK